MASQGGNSERLDLKVGNRSIGLTTRDLLPVLLLVLVGVLGYYRTKTLEGSLHELALRQEQIREDLKAQNAIVHQQTEHLRSELAQQNGLIYDRTRVLEGMLETLNYNINRPLEERLPLYRSPRARMESRADARWSDSAL